ncbi:condensation domain-containing protein [Micromonospora tarensis]|uniref:Condensation protein n=1 Tax=Micromonospora tarensis TaxID=2806100 RepID=A0ABS1YA83_9ACTN|nr:condensation domain-containing protein [Micromonospora tarensis]MBM0274288.1 condensation protein [Micromonospora tarensis]
MSAQPTTTSPTVLQDALWWIGQRARDRAVYNITWRLAAYEPIDVAALKAAYQQLTDRHDALRMSLRRRDDALELVIPARVEASVQVIEFDDPGETPPDVLFQAVAEEVHGREIPLDRAPLVRLVVVRVADRYELLVVGHHAAVDGWALNLLLDDLSQAYGARARGSRHEFGTAAPGFAEYAREQTCGHPEDRWRTSLDHWRKVLDGASAVTVRPDRDQHAGVGSEGTTLRYDFSPQATHGISTLARQAGTTPFSVMLAALQIVLARGGAGPDVTVGVVVANRMSRRDQALVGYLANTCVARSFVTAEDTVADAVCRARDNLWEMMGHQAVPYPTVFAALPAALQTELGGTPPILLNYLGPVSDLRLGTAELSIRPNPGRTARTDLALTYWDDRGGLVAEVEYATARYDERTMLALLRDLDVVLAEDPGTALHSIRVSTRSSRRRPSPVAEPSARTDLSESAAIGLVSDAWAELLGYPPNDLDEDFFASGGHSLNAVQFVAALAERADVRLDLAAWVATPTAGQMVHQLLGAEPPTSAPSTLVSLVEGGDRHLHLIGGAGGTPNDFREIIAALPAGWRVTWSQEREPLDSVPAMARRYRTDLDAAGARPDVICGWSVGGLIGYEMLVQYGDAAPALVLIDSPAPIGYPTGADATRCELHDFVTLVCSSLGVAGAMPRVSGDEVPLTLLALAARLRAKGQAVSADVLFDRWAAYRRQSTAGAAYTSAATVTVPAVLVDAELTTADTRAWAARLRPAPRTVRVDGDHFGVLRGVPASQVADAIAAL